MKKRVLGLLVVVLSLALVLTGCNTGQTGAKEDKLKIGFVYIGSATG